MEGLEISEVKLSEIENNLFRIEAEYYKKEQLSLEKVFSNCNSLSDYTTRIDCGPFGSNLLDTEYRENGTLVVRPFNLKDCTIEQENLVYISDKTIAENRLKIYKKGTLLFSRVGDIKVGISNRDKITISPNIIAAELKNIELAKCLALFFSTKYGFLQIQRHLKISAQPTISTEIISKLKIPNFEKIKQQIVDLFDKSHALLEQSKAAYAEAEQLLLAELGIEEFNISPKPAIDTNIKTLSESFGTTGRLDAEYYQGKYDRLFETFAKLNTKKLGDIVTIKKSIEPGSEAYEQSGIPFVRVSNISKYGMSESDIFLNRDKYFDENLIPKKDTILFSKDGSVGIAYKVEKDLDVITSGALLHLIVKDNEVLPDYLTLVLNSSVVKMQAERDSNGAIIQHWKPSEIEKVVIPLLSDTTQQQIAALVQQSFAQKAKSKALLQQAKTMVETEINTMQ